MLDADVNANALKCILFLGKILFADIDVKYKTEFDKVVEIQKKIEESTNKLHPPDFLHRHFPFIKSRL